MANRYVSLRMKYLGNLLRCLRQFPFGRPVYHSLCECQMLIVHKCSFFRESFSAEQMSFVGKAERADLFILGGPMSCLSVPCHGVTKAQPPLS